MNEENELSKRPFAIDRVQFGAFLAEQRKAKGYTQKELARRLFVSDKAVSKWERGVSLPDISLLMPLAKLLEVSVTELLEGKRMEAGEMHVEDVEALVKKTLTFSAEPSRGTKRERAKSLGVFGIFTFAGCLEWAIFWFCGRNLETDNCITMMGLGILFGIYFWGIARKRLPVYYDENGICAVSDGPFGLHMTGVRFNNNNWRYIVLTGKIYTAAAVLVFPLLGLALADAEEAVQVYVWLAVTLGGMFLPMYAVAKKYE